MALSFLSFCHPRRLSPTFPLLSSSTFPPSVILDISNRGSSVVAFSFSQPTTLDSCFRRNDSFGLSFAIFMPRPLLSSSTFPPLSSSTLVPDVLNRGSSQVKDPVSLSLVFVAAPSHGAFFPLLLSSSTPVPDVSPSVILDISPFCHPRH